MCAYVYVCARTCVCMFVCACVCKVCVCVCKPLPHLRWPLSVSVVAVGRHDDVRVGRSEVADVVGRADARPSTAVHRLFRHGFVEPPAAAEPSAERWRVTHTRCHVVTTCRPTESLTETGHTLPATNNSGLLHLSSHRKPDRNRAHTAGNTQLWSTSPVVPQKACQKPGTHCRLQTTLVYFTCRPTESLTETGHTLPATNNSGLLHLCYYLCHHVYRMVGHVHVQDGKSCTGW